MIKLYQFNSRKKYIFQLKGHQKYCSCLALSKDNNQILYSAGLDNTIRTWNLIQFYEIYNIRIDVIVDEILLFNYQLGFIKFNDHHRSSLCQLNIQLLEPTQTEIRDISLVNIFCDGNWSIFLYANNSIQTVSIKKQFHLNEKIQFPLEYGKLHNVYHLNDNKYAITFDKGICLITLTNQSISEDDFQLKKLVYEQTLHKNNTNNGPNSNFKNDELIQQMHQKLLNTYIYSTLQDKKGIPTAILITYITILTNIIVPAWDMDVKINCKDNYKANFVCLGTDKGYIYFINVNQRRKYHCKISMHAASVSSIEQIVFSYDNNINEGDNQLYFFSCAGADQCIIWNINDKNSPNLLFKFSYTINITFMKMFNNMLLIGQKFGELNIFEIIVKDNLSKKKQVQFYQYHSHQQVGNLKAIISADYINWQKHHIFLTCSQSSTIKIWMDLKLQMIFQMKIFGDAINIRFLKNNTLDFIVQHNNQISIIRSSKIQELSKAEKIIKENYVKVQQQKHLISIHNFMKLQNQSSLSIYNNNNNNSIIFNENIDEQNSFKLKNNTEINNNNSIEISQQNRNKINKSKYMKIEYNCFRVQSDLIKRSKILGYGLPDIIPKNKPKLKQKNNNNNNLNENKIKLPILTNHKYKSFSRAGRFKQ